MLLTKVHLLATLVGTSTASGIYSQTSAVLEITGQTYNSVIRASNHTTLLEFYAPWCGHCQNLKAIYEKAATQLTGLVTVAAVNCDDEANKPFCGSMNVPGFPTLKIIKPSSRKGKPSVSDYQGAREVKAIVNRMVDEIPSHVKRLKDDGEPWVRSGEMSKVVLFSDKGSPAPLFKALAVDFLGMLEFGFASKKKILAKTLGVTGSPVVVFVAGDTVRVYDGKIAKGELQAWIEQVADVKVNAPVVGVIKEKPKKSGKKAGPASSSFSAASEKARTKSVKKGKQETILAESDHVGSGVVKDASPLDSKARSNVDEPEPIQIKDIPQSGTETTEDVPPPDPQPVDKGANEAVRTSIRDEL